MIKKIVVIGPESTGKSTLCEQLAQHYHTAWCPEYAREYLISNGNKYDYEDLLTIANGQVLLEEKIIQAAKHKKHSFVLIDTNMYVMKVWCEFVFGKCHTYILEQIKKRKYDMYLLCYTDLSWVKDDLREYPDLETRQRLYEIYKNIMTQQPVPWIEIKGNNRERLLKAITTIDSLLKT
ncbi:MAG: AAA family ATPase [Chitinophagaceae bacterium]